jgi:hypothetical protein
MQMMFQKQHFGRLAVGLSDVDENRERHIRHLNEEPFESDRDRFYTVTSGGIHHPWEHKEFETRVAITADGLVFDEDAPMGEEKCRIYAKVECMTGEVYLFYTYPSAVISCGLPDPIKMAEQIVDVAVKHLNGESHHISEERWADPEHRWAVVDKPQVPVYHRSLLGKVMSRVNSAFTQGHEFFQDPKSR